MEMKEAVQEEYNRLEKEERELCFPWFSSKLAWKIGEEIIKRESEIGVVAFEIVVNGQCLLAYYPKGTTKNNANWIRRKRNTVDYRAMSSLRMSVWLALHGKTQESCMMDQQTFAVVGGGFPICLVNGMMIGSICVSGLEHHEDHRIVQEAIRACLERMTTTESAFAE